MALPATIWSNSSKPPLAARNERFPGCHPE
jgi:hypothetical protein